MIKLLNAGFARLRKSRLFLLYFWFTMGAALLMCIARYSDMKNYGDTVEIEQFIFNYATMTGIIIAVFTSLFLGVEYSDGTIRNKICVGHRRIDIYLSNFFAVTATSLFFYVLFIAVIAVIGIPLFGLSKMPLTELMMKLGCIFTAVTAYCSIFTFIAMVISNKAITALISITTAFVLMIMAVACFSSLQEPQYVEYGSIINSDIGDIEILREPNPRYPGEEKRKVFQALCDVNPSGQIYQIAGDMGANLNILPLYSFGIIVIFTAAGIVLLWEKDIK